eukprot:CAMPEP_0172886304 /NCGR_PEP_ID=MMETSP1075-20121228/130568_1 /TAXON_ID=2916 /ORGANISM="Ceratium fusus, Strain PA161109" /LENGTH=70 /DNA_ID=CAMNT_0013739767 /DNA_START=29 /DNA_END=237 /DNA_ORIENTATION=-
MICWQLAGRTRCAGRAKRARAVRQCTAADQNQKTDWVVKSTPLGGDGKKLCGCPCSDCLLEAAIVEAAIV